MTPDFHGPHADAGGFDAGSVDWRDPLPRFCRVRVLRHTCECRARIYEFCAAAGLAWIRRTDRSPTAVTVKESRPTSYGEAEALWEKLLSGR
ncbi:hypothetical protein OUY22_03850 [Nonomuraea sp. MCN248]|uniref:Uncharacterized protein n=1 Tax=Nonomuraea corallina TaxID=2989783 RepID=A0ABT4S662_9ACTN|nr:hypothetical protein [Nonomuraea corallina]MDA0632538.1 hypothetical protein [Nonomuraea corallina]